MCTLAFAWQQFEAVPLVVGANRDEAADRPSSPPAVHGDAPRVLMPRDDRAGGTWLGVNDHGVFVAVTNRRGTSDRAARVAREQEGTERETDDTASTDDGARAEQTAEDPAGARSRGLLVTDALAASSAGDALETVEREVADRAYAGFNLVVADAGECVLLQWDGVLRTHDFDAGTHVVVNEGFDDGAAKSRAVRDALAGRETPSEWLAAARDALRDHDTGACVHRDGFGTRSSSLVTVREDGAVDYEFADGPPCETAYRRVDATL